MPRFASRSRLRAAPWTAHAAGVLASAFLFAFLAWPLGAILARGLGEPGAALAALVDPWTWERLAATLVQATASTVASLAVGLPTALLASRYRFPGRRLLRSAMLVPFVMPSLVMSLGILALAGPRGALGVDLRDTLWIVLLAHVAYNHAVVVRIVGGHLEAVAPRLREAAATLGAPPWSVERRVTLPLAAPAALAAATLVFLFSFTAFGTVLVLAPAWATLEVEIYRRTARLLQLDAAAALALLQLAAAGLATLAYVRLQERLAVPLDARPAELPPARGAAAAAVAVLAPLALLLALSPLLALTVQALREDGGWTLARFAGLLEPPATLAVAPAGLAIRNSLRVGAASALVAVAAGGLFAYAVARGGWRWLDGASLLPLATSAVTLGFGYLIAFPGLATGFAGIVLAHALIGFPFAARALLPALRALPDDLRDAAGTLGAGPLRTLARVELPLLAPAAATAASLAFAASVGDFGAAMVLRRPELATLPVAIFDRLGRPGEAGYGAALALSTVLMVVTAAALVAIDRAARGPGPRGEW